jgi:LPS export ABC transporter protein LptC
LILLAGLLALLAGCRKESSSPPAGAGAEEFDLPADNVFFLIRETMLSNGVVTAVLTADTAFVWDGQRRVDLRVVNIEFHDERGVKTGTLTSQTGEFDGATFIGHGSVVLVTENPSGSRTLETEQITFELRDDVISTDHPFTLTEAGRSSRGTNFRTDSRFSNWEVRGLESTGTVPGQTGF